MSNEMQDIAYAYYLTHQGKDFTMAERWYPRGELVLVIEDKLRIALRKFGRKAVAAARPTAERILDEMIANGSFANKENEYGGTMHQFQTGRYREYVKSADNQAAGDDVWITRFEAAS